MQILRCNIKALSIGGIFYMSPKSLLTQIYNLINFTQKVDKSVIISI